MAEYTGEYGHPYPRVDQYGNPVPPVDQYGNPIPREPVAHSSVGTTLPSSSYGAGETAGYMASSEHTAVSSGEYGGGGGVSYGLVGAEHPHERVVRAAGAAAYPHGVVSSEGGAGGTGAQLQPTRQEEHTATTLGEKLRRSGSSSSSSSSEDDGQGGRRKKKSIKEKIKEKLPGGHKQQDEHAVPAAGAETHAAGKHEKKGIMEKIKEKLPGHH